RCCAGPGSTWTATGTASGSSPACPWRELERGGGAGFHTPVRRPRQRVVDRGEDPVPFRVGNRLVRRVVVLQPTLGVEVGHVPGGLQLLLVEVDETLPAAGHDLVVGPGQLRVGVVQ